MFAIHHTSQLPLFVSRPKMKRESTTLNLGCIEFMKLFIGHEEEEGDDG